MLDSDSYIVTLEDEQNKKEICKIKENELNEIAKNLNITDRYEDSALPFFLLNEYIKMNILASFNEKIYVKYFDKKENPYIHCFNKAQ